MKLSIIIPVYNEQDIILEKLKALRNICPDDIQLIVSDGGSSDETAALAKSCVDTIVSSTKGRSYQMNAGANVATGDLLLFLHIDSVLPGNYLQCLADITRSNHTWGRFDVSFTNTSFVFSLIAFMMNFRSRITGVATGDQAIFMTRTVFNKVNGFPEIDLMEDIAICKKLRKTGSPLCIKEKVITSSRRWEENGIFKTIVLMWFLRLLYFLRIHPDKLGKIYG